MRRNYCRSILLLWYPPSHSLWINLWTCMVSELSCHLWEATIVWTPVLSVVYICVCWPPKRRVYTITSLLLQHSKYLLLLCCLPHLPSQGVTLLYRPTSVDKASVHIVKGITQNMHKNQVQQYVLYVLVPVGLQSTTTTTYTYCLHRT